MLGAAKSDSEFPDTSVDRPLRHSAPADEVEDRVARCQTFVQSAQVCRLRHPHEARSVSPTREADPRTARAALPVLASTAKQPWTRPRVRGAVDRRSGDGHGCIPAPNFLGSQAIKPL